MHDDELSKSTKAGVAASPSANITSGPHDGPHEGPGTPVETPVESAAETTTRVSRSESVRSDPPDDSEPLALHSPGLWNDTSIEAPNPEGHPPPPISKGLTYRLYTSHFLSTWNSRLFEFGATLFLASIYPGTLLPMSVYALVRSGAAIVLSPAVGSWIDQGNRLHVVRLSIVGQRLAVAASCGIFWILEDKSSPFLSLGKGKTALFGLSVVLACVEKLCAVMNLVSVERDWVVVITSTNEPARQLLNARLRRIDLLCKLLGPLLISLINGTSVLIAIWTTLGMSITSLPFEYVFIARVYSMVPGLAHCTPETANVDRPVDSNTPLLRAPRIPWTTRMRSVAISTLRRILPLEFIPFYFSHPSFLPSLALAMLYLTVLSFSGQMITFLLFTGYTSLHVGIARTVSTLVELSATWAAPQIAQRIGVVRGGIWFLSWQMVWLAAGVSFFFIDDRGQGEDAVRSVSGLVGGVILSRVGLWGFDLCAQSIVQDTVTPDHRGAFSTVEAAFQNLFELLAYASTIIFSRPEQFQYPVVISMVATYSAGALFAAYVRRKRGHLVHFPACLKVRRIPGDE